MQSVGEGREKGKRLREVKEAGKEWWDRYKRKEETREERGKA